MSIKTISGSTILGNSITTRFLKATATRGPRIKARLLGIDFDTVTIAWQYDLDTAGNHSLAARKLADLWSDRVLTQYGEKHRVTFLTGFRVNNREYGFGLKHGE